MAKLRRRGRVWWSDLYIDGQRVRKPLSTDKRFAEGKLADLMKQRNGIRYGHPAQGISFQSFKERALSAVKPPRGKKVTYLQYKRAFKDFRFASIEQLTPETLERRVSSWQDDEVGDYEINARIRSVKAAMRRAEAWGYIKPQRWDTVKEIKKPKGRLLFYTKDQVEQLLGRAIGPWRTVVFLGALAGLRRSEIAALRWTDVDRERNRIHITAYDAFQGSTEKIPAFTPKDFERRWVPMTKSLRRHLEKLPRRGELVLGRAYSPGVLSAYFTKIIRKAGLPGSLHTLRHTFAAWLASAGIPLFTISKLLGHASVKTTEIYAHLAPDTQAAAVDVLPAL